MPTNVRPLKQRAWGMPGAQCTRSLVCAMVTAEMHTSIHSEFTGITRHSRTQWFYGLLRALPGDRAFLPPSPRGYPQSMTPASRRQDHTTSPSAGHALVRGAARVHRISSRVRDDRDTPPVSYTHLRAHETGRNLV